MGHLLSKQNLDNLFTSPRVFNMPAPQTATATASMTDAQMLGGVLEVNNGGSGATTLTTRTGTQIDSAFSGRLRVDDAFDLYVINVSTSANDALIIAVGTDVTLVGNNDIEEEDAIANSSSGLFRFRKTAANTFTMYRLA